MNATFAVLEMFLWLLYATGAALAGLTFLHPAFAFAFLLSYLAIQNVNFHQFINLFKITKYAAYYSNIWRSLALHIYSIVCFAVIYYALRGSMNNLQTVWDSLFFSAAMWTTLGFESITPTSYVRIIVAAQAISGLFAFSMLISLVWLYANDALATRAELKGDDWPAGAKMRLHTDLGLFVRTDDDGNPTYQNGDDFFAHACSRCGSSNVRILTGMTMRHEIAHLPEYVTQCGRCGRKGPIKFTAHRAVTAWNRLNRRSGQERAEPDSEKVPPT